MVEVGDRLECICYVDLDVIKVPSAIVQEITKFAGLWRFDFEDGQTYFARDWDYIWLDIDQNFHGCQAAGDGDSLNQQGRSSTSS